MGDCVLVGVDGSEASLVALDWAADEAALRGLRVEILRCTSRPLFEPYASEAYEAFERAARTTLDREKGGVQDRHPGVPVAITVSADFPRRR